LLIVLIYIGISLYNAKKNTVFPDPEHLPRRMDVQFQRNVPNAGVRKRGYNHVGDTTATSNLIKATEWGIMPESTDWVSKTGKTAICAKHACEQIRRHGTA
jgi:hypothetical protein